VNVTAVRDIQERFGNQIYRPGEDDMDDLTDEEKSERRAQIEQMFQSGDTEFDVNGDNVN
jgi:hypothetical protein